MTIKRFIVVPAWRNNGLWVAGEIGYHTSLLSLDSGFESRATHHFMNMKNIEKLLIEVGNASIEYSRKKELIYIEYDKNPAMDLTYITETQAQLQKLVGELMNVARNLAQK